MEQHLLHLQPGPPDGAVVLGEVVEGALVHPGAVPEHESRDLSAVDRQDLEKIKQNSKLIIEGCTEMDCKY